MNTTRWTTPPSTRSSSPTCSPHLNCSPLQILDLGAGTAQIPIELARRALYTHITAVDAAASMLALARANIAAANLTDRIDLILADAKHLPFADNAFPRRHQQ